MDSSPIPRTARSPPSSSPTSTSRRPMQRCNPPHAVNGICTRAPCDRPLFLSQIKWNVWSFDEGLASRVPYESAARTLTQHKRSMAAFTTRQGLAITMEVRGQHCPRLEPRASAHPVPRAHLASSSAAQLHDVRRRPRELPAAAQADRGKHPVSPPAPCSALNQHAASALTPHGAPQVHERPRRAHGTRPSLPGPRQDFGPRQAVGRGRRPCRAACAPPEAALSLSLPGFLSSIPAQGRACSLCPSLGS